MCFFFLIINFFVGLLFFKVFLLVFSGSVRVVLAVEEVTVERSEECGGDLTFPLQRDKLLSVLKHQVRTGCGQGCGVW